MNILGIFKSKWSVWHDVSLSEYAGRVYLLQARRHNNGRIQFAIRTHGASMIGSNRLIEISELPIKEQQP